MLIPKVRPLEVSVPKKTSFHVPEGCYRAKIRDIDKKFVEKANCTGEVIKFFFEIEIPSEKKTVYLAKLELRNDMNTGSELCNLVTRLLGNGAVNEAAGGKLDLEKMIGMEVIVEIEHIITSKRDEYTFPLVKVRDVQRVSTPTPTEKKEIKP